VSRRDAVRKDHLRHHALRQRRGPENFVRPEEEDHLRGRDSGAVLSRSGIAAADPQVSML
jgi:hypothetical protein